MTMVNWRMLNQIKALSLKLLYKMQSMQRRWMLFLLDVRRDLAAWRLVEHNKTMEWNGGRTKAF